MRNYHIYGIGNALLDINFEVSDETLTRLGIEKGVMTLIDAERELVLLEELDGIKRLRSCGGSAANTLITAQYLGSQGFYSCKVAKDEAGDKFYRDLLGSGLHSNLAVQERPEGVTGKSIVMITPDAQRTMNTYLGITESFSKQELHAAALSDAEYLYIEGYLVASPTGREAMHVAKDIARRSGTKISLTLSDLMMVRHFKTELEALIGEGIDFLFSNQEEALAFCDTTQLSVACEQLKALAKGFAITLGKLGCLIFDGEHYHEVAGFPVQAIDTVGAGDTFAGAFLHGITQGQDIDTAAKVANFAAAQVVSKFGPRLDPEHVQAVKTFAESALLVSE